MDVWICRGCGKYGYVCVCLRLYVFTCVSVCVSVCMSMCPYMYVHVWMCSCACGFSCLSICMYLYICIYTFCNFQRTNYIYPCIHIFSRDIFLSTVWQQQSINKGTLLRYNLWKFQFKREKKRILITLYLFTYIQSTNTSHRNRQLIWM